MDGGILFDPFAESRFWYAIFFAELGLWFTMDWRNRRQTQTFDEIKAREAKDTLFISMNGISWLEKGVKSIFKDTVIQRCIVHLICNLIKYVPSKDYKAYIMNLKKFFISWCAILQHNNISTFLDYSNCSLLDTIVTGWLCCFSIYA